MAHCPHCQTQFQDAAAACPQCGQPTMQQAPPPQQAAWPTAQRAQQQLHAQDAPKADRSTGPILFCTLFLPIFALIAVNVLSYVFDWGWVFY